MMGNFIKLLGFLFGIIVIIPLIFIINIFLTLRNFMWALIISFSFFQLILGFSGIMCFWSILVSISIHLIGQWLYKRIVEIINKNETDNKFNKVMGITDIIDKL